MAYFEYQNIFTQVQVQGEPEMGMDQTGENILGGEEGRGFYQMMSQLPQERLVIAAGAVGAMEGAVERTIAYAKERQAFGGPILQFQNTRFKLAECAIEVEVGRAFLDTVITQHMSGQVLVKECSMAKLWQTEMLGEVVDACLQFFGGYGYMLEYPVTRAYMDARVSRIYAGTNEMSYIQLAEDAMAKSREVEMQR